MIVALYKQRLVGNAITNTGHDSGYGAADADEAKIIFVIVNFSF